MGSPALAAVRDTPVEALEGTPLLIGGKTFHVGVISWDQLISIARLVKGVIDKAKNTDEVRPLIDAFRGAGKQAADAARGDAGPPSDDDVKARLVDSGLATLDGWIQALFALLDGPTFAQLWSILLDEDPAWCKANVRPLHVAKIVAAVRDNNDPPELMAAFQEAARGWLPRSSTPDQPA